MITRAGVFYILTFVFTIVIGGAQEALGISPGTMILPQLAPGIEALLMLLLFRKDGFRIEFFGSDRKKITLALLIPAVLAGAVMILNTLVFRLYPGENLSGLPWAMVIWMPFGALGEELGWRGYLQKMISREKSSLYGAVLTGILWAGWHVGIYGNGPVYFLFFLLLMVSYSIVLSFLCGSGFSVLVASVFHFMINLTNLFSFNSIGSENFIITNSLVWAALALFIIRKQQMKEKGPDLENS